MTKPTASARLAASGLAPRGLSRDEAAAYLGIAPHTFDNLVRAGQMPPPKRLGERRLVWDIRAIDAAFEALPEAAVPGRPATPDDDPFSRVAV